MRGSILTDCIESVVDRFARSPLGLADGCRVILHLEPVLVLLFLVSLHLYVSEYTHIGIELFVGETIQFEKFILSLDLCQMVTDPIGYFKS